MILRSMSYPTAIKRSLLALWLAAPLAALAETWNPGPTTAPFRMYPNNTATKIGIGLTSDPTAQLQVSTLGAGTSIAVDANIARFGWRLSAGRAVEMSVDYRGASLGDGFLVLREDRSGKDFMAVNLLATQDRVVFPNGRLGVGISPAIMPAAEFHFQRDGVAGPATMMLVRGNANGNNPLRALVLSHCNTPAAGNVGQALEQDFTMEGPGSSQHRAAQIRVAKEADFTSTANIDANLSFSTTYDGTLRERMRLNAIGNVGIGTSAPGSLQSSPRGRVLEISAAGVGANQHPGIVLRSGSSFSAMPAWEMLLSSASTNVHTDFQLVSGGIGRMIVSGQTGNVGIGEVTGAALDGVLNIQRVDWQAPMIAVQGNAGGNNTLRALSLRHNNTPSPGQLNQAVEVEFSMEGPGGTQHNAARLRVGKESDFTGNTGNVDSYLAFHTTQNGSSVERARITSDGTFKVGGAIDVGSVKTRVWSVAPDYVFEKDYKLASLDHVEDFISRNKHLPEIPSAKRIASEGIDLAEMNMKLLKKVEELTLYAIEQKKRDKAQQEQIEDLKRIVASRGGR